MNLSETPPLDIKQFSWTYKLSKTNEILLKLLNFQRESVVVLFKFKTAQFDASQFAFCVSTKETHIHIVNQRKAVQIKLHLLHLILPKMTDPLTEPLAEPKTGDFHFSLNIRRYMTTRPVKLYLSLLREDKRVVITTYQPLRLHGRWESDLGGPQTVLSIVETEVA